MPPASRKNSPLLAAVLILVVGILLGAILNRPDAPSAENPPYVRGVAALGAMPTKEDWEALKAYDGVLTQDQFTRLLSDLYTWGGNGEEWRGEQHQLRMR